MATDSQIKNVKEISPILVTYSDSLIISLLQCQFGCFFFRKMYRELFKPQIHELS